MEDSDEDKKYNARCAYYTSLTDTSQPVVYLVRRGDFIFYTRSKEQALAHINNMIDFYCQGMYTIVEKYPETTNDIILFEAILNRGSDDVHIKVVEVPALKDMGQREQYSPQSGTMYFYTLQLNKETVYRGYTSFFGDAVHIRVDVVDNFVDARDKKYFWQMGISRRDKQCVLKVFDRLHRKIQKSYAHINGEYINETPVFDFYKAYDLENY